MGLMLQLVETRADGGTRSVELMELGRPGNLHDIAELGLTLPEAKQLLACVQQAIVAVQARDHAMLRPDCASCGERFRIKDWRSRPVATLFGEVVVRLPRFRCPGCGRGETGTNWPAPCRSTPELDQRQAPLSALMTYRVAAGVLAHLLPVAAGTSHGTLRRHTLELGERLRAATVEPDSAEAAAAPAIALSLDATFIRSCHEGERHLEVRVGNAETPGGSRQLFGAVANAGTDIVALIRRTLDTMGRTSDTELSAFTDGCSSMRSILAEAGVTDPPILDWFHLSMRLQHVKQAAGSLPADGPDRAQARAAIAAEVERLRWRTWNGKAKDARITLERIHALLPSFESEPARKLRRALDAVDRYLRSQSAHLVNYAERHRAGLLLEVRCSLNNGTVGTAFGKKFLPTNHPHPPMAVAS